jgi:flavin-dependent dehydrogenase
MWRWFSDRYTTSLQRGSGDAMSTSDARRSARSRAEPPITVVGAGPAGLACAIALARGGRAVVVRERWTEVGHRFHGDFQGLENWTEEKDVLDELGEAGIAATFEHHPMSRGTAFDANGKHYALQSERPLFYLVRRGSENGSLDLALLDHALDAGVEVCFGDRVDTPDGPAVLAAGPHVADAIAAGYTFETDLSDGAWLALDNLLAPLGYAYLLVHSGRGTIATCMFTGFKKQAEYLARTAAFFSQHVDFAMRNPRPFGGFANFSLPRTAVQGGHPVVGEQAGFQDALAGFGMRYAVRSGLLAARSILEGVDYEELWRRELAPLLRTGVVNRFLFNTVGQPGWRLALRRLSRADTGAVLRRFYRPSWFGRSLFPLARLHYRRQLRDRSCDHIDCQCVWCEHAADATPPIACVQADRIISVRQKRSSRRLIGLLSLHADQNLTSIKDRQRGAP